MPIRPLRWLGRILLAVSLAAGLAVVPTQGADTHLERPKPRIALAAADQWRLRPTHPAVPAPVTTGSLRVRTAAPIPDERRNVRLVYPALVEAR